MRTLIAIFLLCAVSLTGCAERPGPTETESGNSGTETVVSPPAGETTTGTETENLPEGENETEINLINLTVNGTVLTAELADNSSARALCELLAEGLFTIAMSDYGNMEKAGPLGTDLPANNEQITTQAGDLILYQGNAFVTYYALNSWNFTRLGRIKDMAAEELKELLGGGDAEVTLSLPD